MPNLKVLRLADRDVYKDIVRITEAHRLDKNGNPIEEGTICWIGGTPRKSVVTLRGFQPSTDPEIRMDDRTRIRLGVQSGECYDFEFTRAGICGQLWWAWSASETGYKVASRMALIGLLLGVLAFIPILQSWLKDLWEWAKPIIMILTVVRILELLFAIVAAVLWLWSASVKVVAVDMYFDGSAPQFLKALSRQSRLSAYAAISTGIAVGCQIAEFFMKPALK